MGRLELCGEAERVAWHLVQACLSQVGSWQGNPLLAPLAQSTQTRNLPRSQLTVCFLGNLYQLRVPCSQETRGVVLTFQLLQAACHLRVLFPRSMLEGGIWPATEPTEQVWPFLGEHLKGSWQDPEYKAGNTPEGGRKRAAENTETLSGAPPI